MNRDFKPHTGYDLTDGEEPHVTLSPDNPVRVEPVAPLTAEQMQVTADKLIAECGTTFKQWYASYMSSMEKFAEQMDQSTTPDHIKSAIVNHVMVGVEKIIESIGETE